MSEINKEDLISKDALAVLDELNKTLLSIDKSFVQIAKTAKKASSDLSKGTGIKKQREESEKLVAAEKRLKLAQSDLGKEITKVNVQTQEQNKLNKQAARDAKGLTDQYDKLNAQRTKAQKILKNLIVSEKASTKEIKAAQREFNRLDKAVRKANVAAKDGRQDVGRYAKAWGGMKSLFAAGGIMIGFQAFFSVLKNGVNVIKDYTTANSTLRGILNKNAKETAGLRKQQQALGATTSFTAAEITKTQTELARLGLSIGQITNLTPAILDSAVALGVDMASAAELVAGQLNAFGLQASEGTRVADVLTKATQISAFNFERLKTALGIVSPAAKAVGASLEQVTGILTSVVDSGIDASSAGTALRNVFIQLEEKGISWDDAMKKINTSQNKLSAASELFGVKGAVVANVIADNTDKINQNTKALNNAAGAAQKFADEQLNNLEGDLKLLTSAWEGFILSVESGEGILAKALRATVSLLTGAINGMTTLDTQFRMLFNDLDELSGKDLDVVINFGTTESGKSIKDVIDSQIAGLSEGRLADNVDFFTGKIVKALVLQGETFEDSEVIAKRWASSINTLATEASESVEEMSKDVEKQLTFQNGVLRKSIQEQIAEIRKLTNHFLGFGEDLEKDLAESARSAGEKRLLARGAEIEKEIDLEKKKNERLKKIKEDNEEDLKQGSIDLAIDTALQLSNLRIEAIAIQRDQNQAERENELVANDEATARALLAAEGNEQEKRRIQEVSKLREAQINEQFARKEARLKAKQAQAEKQNALFEIAINTAIAIASANAIGPPQNIPAMILAAAAGAIQAALVLARPVPAFKDGGLVGTDGRIRVSEQGREMFVDKHGALGITPEKEAIMRGMKGATIVPHAATEEILGTLDDAKLGQSASNILIPQHRQNSQIDSMRGDIKQLNRTMKSIANRPIEITELTGTGIKKTIINAFNTTEIKKAQGFQDHR